jgi:methionine-rich copper-binding protein CopC
MRLTVLGTIVAPLLFLGSGAPMAHAFLDHAEPRVGSTIAAAPREVALSFTESLEPAFCTIEVTNAAGERMDEGKPSVTGNMMRVPLRAILPGTYRVKWHVLSVDTHATEGAFSFQVRQ